MKSLFASSIGLSENYPGALFTLRSSFATCLTLVIGYVKKYRDFQVAQMLHDQRIHVRPLQPADAGRKPRHREAPAIGLFKLMPEVAQTVVNVSDRRPARFGTVRVFAFLGKEVKNPDAARACPTPHLPRLWSRLMGIVTKILRHGGPGFPQQKRQTAAEVFVGCNAVGNALRPAEQDVAGDFVDHESNLSSTIG